MDKSTSAKIEDLLEKLSKYDELVINEVMCASFSEDELFGEMFASQVFELLQQKLDEADNIGYSSFDVGRIKE